MINRIHIRNFAIIDQLDLVLKPGLTVITGETGSGKSIILQALSVALGMKPTKTMVRTDQERAVVEANLNHDRDQIDLTRVIPLRGRVKNHINDEPVNEVDYREKTLIIADFHGQHEQQLIMNSATHINYLDNFAGNENLVKELSSLHERLEAIQLEMKSSLTRKKRAAERQELLQYQLNEISTIAPKPGEDIELHNEFRIGSNREEMVQIIDGINTSLKASDTGISSGLTNIVRDLEKLKKIDNSLSGYINMVNESLINLQEVNSGLMNHIRTLDFDQDKLREIEDRLQSLESLKRKYGGSLESVLEKSSAIERELTGFGDLESQIGALQDQLEKLQADYQQKADRIHKLRITAVNRLSQAIENEMEKLQMPGARFEIMLKQLLDQKSPFFVDSNRVRYYPNGYDVVEFYLSANPGEIPKPLTQIASGGEVSRIMLAIKTVLQSNDPVFTLIFDEIDSGISGSAAELVAENLVNLAREKQVICITHLPQIAVRANQHLQVSKQVSDNKTSVKAVYLDRDKIYSAIAGLSSGTNTSATDMAAAKKLYERYHG